MKLVFLLALAGLAAAAPAPTRVAPENVPRGTKLSGGGVDLSGHDRSYGPGFPYAPLMNFGGIKDGPIAGETGPVQAPTASQTVPPLPGSPEASWKPDFPPGGPGGVGKPVKHHDRAKPLANPALAPFLEPLRAAVPDAPPNLPTLIPLRRAMRAVAAAAAAASSASSAAPSPPASSSASPSASLPAVPTYPASDSDTDEYSDYDENMNPVPESPPDLDATLSAFESSPDYSTLALTQPLPPGYTLLWSNANASTTQMPYKRRLTRTYSASACAEECAHEPVCRGFAVSVQRQTSCASCTHVLEVGVCELFSRPVNVGAVTDGRREEVVEGVRWTKAVRASNGYGEGEAVTVTVTQAVEPSTVTETQTVTQTVV